MEVQYWPTWIDCCISLNAAADQSSCAALNVSFDTADDAGGQCMVKSKWISYAKDLDARVAFTEAETRFSTASFLCR